MAVVLIGLYFSLSASAKTTPEFCDEIEPTPFNYIDELYIPMFNQEQGQLKKVTMTVVSKGWMETKIESEDPLPRTYTVVANGIIIPNLPNLGELPFEISIDTTNGNNIFAAGADDEPGKWNPDWAGVDYKSIPTGSPSNPIYSQPNPAVFLFEDAQLAPFKGYDGDVVTIPVRTDSSFTASGGGEYVIGGDTTMGVKICVVYEYDEILYCINGSKVGCDNEPLSGWTITLTKPDGSTDTRTTDANGEYSFCDLKAGSYKVSEETRPDWYPVGQTSQDVQLPDQTTGKNAEDINFKNTQHFCITGYKYNVTNNAEEPLSGWTITLTKPDGSTVTDTTDASGYYEFCDLANGQYKVSEELKSGWIAKSPVSVNVELYCENESVDFRNALQPNLVCVCPFFIKNELYGANIREVKVVDASAGILANDPAGSVVLNPQSITIDPKYGTLFVDEDGSFVYDPTVATGRLYSGQYVIFKYTANNGLCDSQYPGIAKIQLRK